MDRPNFLFIMADQQTASTVNSPLCRTPHLDALGDGGVRFRRAHTVNAICSPARASLFTGLQVHAHGMYDCTHTVDDARANYRAELPTWSRALAEAGYHCAYFGKWHVERTNDLGQFGWRHYQVWPGGTWWAESDLPQDVTLNPGLSLERNGYRTMPLWGVVDRSPDETPTGRLFTTAAGYLKDQLRDQEPWCLFVSTPEPHDPYIVPRSHFGLYDAATISPPPSFTDDLTGKPNVLKRLQAVFTDLEWEDFAQATACYYANCTLIDSYVGRLLETLERTGQADNTIVVYCSDHGDLLGAHRLLAKGVTPYEEVYNIPLIVCDRRRPTGGADCDRLVSLGDLCPTVLDLAGLAPFARSHFRSLTPLLDDPRDTAWADEAYAEFHGQRYFYTQRILWHEHYKYIFNAFDYDELYDLAQDPAEMQNRIADPDLADVRQNLLCRLWRQVHATGDDTLAQAHYWTMRFLEAGPDSTPKTIT